MSDEIFFITTDIEQRKRQQKERLDKIEKNIKIAIYNLKHINSVDPKEQLFIDLFKNMIIKVDEHEGCLALFNQDNACGYYLIENNSFWFGEDGFIKIIDPKYIRCPSCCEKMQLFIDNMFYKFLKINCNKQIYIY